MVLTDRASTNDISNTSTNANDYSCFQTNQWNSPTDTVVPTKSDSDVCFVYNC